MAARPAIALALMALAQPAEACHRFARWSYPYPQRCAAKPPASDNDPVWYVEITKLPPLDERDVGIENLKKALATKGLQ